MKCAACGNENPEEAKFCGVCGDSLNGYAAQVGMVSFPDAVKLGFRRYFQFRGRSTRAEYWWWILFQAIALSSVLVIDGLLGFGTVLYMIALLGFIMPNCAVLARRLHDTNKTGWWTLIMAVPFGGLVLLIFILQPSDKFTNRYG